MASEGVPESGQKTRLKRTRTGCLKCRVRRRKCDEKKPSCQRCVDSGFVCQYGTRLSFLDKNNLTTSAPGKTTRQSYSTLRFIDTSSALGQSTLSSPPPPQTKSPNTNEARDHTSSQPQRDPDIHGNQTSPLRSDSSFQAPTPHPEPIRDLPTPAGAYNVDTSPSNGAYETALNVLTSLGSANTRTPAPRPVTGHGPSPHGSHTPSSFTGLGFGTSNTGPPEEFPTCTLLPQDSAVQLLRHYRYSVAPWLDIGDPTQTFGLDVSRFATTSGLVLESLLALSLTCLDRYADLDIGSIIHMHPAAHEASLAESLVIIALMGVQRHAATSPLAWQSPYAASDLGLLESTLDLAGYGRMHVAAARVLLRLDVSVGLINSQPVSIPSVLLYDSELRNPSNMATETLMYSWDPLVLCALALNYCFGNELEQSAGAIVSGMGTAQRWKMLTDALVMWYDSRPNELKPMLEIAQDDQLFPLILFSSGTAVLFNQLFHTAMLLLLQQKPRTLTNSSARQGGVTMSPLWHAQRICGISMNNDSRQSWDFCLIGSLYTGAQRMTYEPQQQALLAGLKDISRTTGWELGCLEARLRSEWQHG